MFRYKRSNHRGFSLVELVIAIGLGIFILTSGVLILTKLFSSTSSFALRNKVQEKFEIAQNMIRVEAIGNYHNMTRTNQIMTIPTYPEVQISASISTEHSDSKTRTATLTAQ